MSDMVIDATFLNPYSSTTGEWDYGFEIRRTSPGDFDMVTVSSDGRWRHWVRRGGNVETDEVLGGRNRSLLFILRQPGELSTD